MSETPPGLQDRRPPEDFGLKYLNTASFAKEQTSSVTGLSGGRMLDPHINTTISHYRPVEKMP